MNATRRAEIRLQVAQGHWALGEHSEALAALDRAAREDPTSQALMDWIDATREEVRDGPIARYLEALQAQLLPTFRGFGDEADADSADAGLRSGPGAAPHELPATPTLAELLADQGHREKALQITDDVLRKNPADARALAVRDRLKPAPRAGERQLRTLERWLVNLKRRKRREVYG